MADGGRGCEVRHVGRIGGDLPALDKALRRLLSQGRALHVVYQAGPCGFVIWRHLQAQIVLGSDFPYRRSLEQVKGLHEAGVFDERSLLMIERQTPLSLLPRRA